MNFWLKRIIIALIIVGLALTVFLNIDYLMSFNDSLMSNETAAQVDKDNATTLVKNEDTTNNSSQTEAPVKQKTKGKVKSYSKNAAAEGLSRFYASINPEEGNGPKIVNGVVFLPDPKDNLEKFMEARRMVTRPLPKKWKGTKKSYVFREGQTLYQKISEYAKKDKLEVIWRLNRDLLVKDPFRINKGLFKMAYQIGQALNGHFPGGVFTYFCYKHRALVFIEYHNKYLDKQCILLKGSSY